MNNLKKAGLRLSVVIMILSIVLSVFCITAYAKDDGMSSAFKKVLNGGKLVLNSVEPTNIDDQMFYSALDNFMLENPKFGVNIIDDSTSKIKLILNSGSEKQESHVVDIVWKYNSKVLQEAKKIGNKLPKSGTTLSLTDLELVNYWAYYNPASPRQTLVNYSGELKAIIKNTNFTLASQSHGGAVEPFFTSRGGPATLCHNKTTYYAVGAISAKAQHIIYVPENTADTKQALLTAVQKRIDDYMGKGVIKVTATSETVTSYYNGELANFDKALETAKKELPKAQAKLDAENAKEESERDQQVIDQYSNEVFEYEQTIANTPEQKQNFIDSFKKDGLFYFLKKAAGDFVFKAEVIGKDKSFKFIIVKDNNKLAAPSYESVDFETKVSVSTDSSGVPLDTVIEVDKLTEGKEYDRICKVIDSDNNEMFDIKLHSDTLDNYVTKLKNGKFLVKIPVPEKFKGKSLQIYYVDANNKATEHKATEKDGFVCFETDHFSVYTLVAKAESDSATTDKDNSQTTTTEPDSNSTTTIGPSGESTNSEQSNDDQDAEDTDKGSNAVLWVVLALVLVAGLGIAGFFVFMKIRKQKGTPKTEE